VDESVCRIAARIRAWRHEAGLSLQQLANRSGVSPSTIHKIEHCQTVPTIAVLLKLATGFGRRAIDLFDDIPDATPATHVRAAERDEARTAQGVVLQTLTREPARRDISVWRVVHPPGFSFGDRTMQHYDGEMVIYLERGRLHVHVDEERYQLETGDTLHFKASSPHAWRNDDQEDAVALIFGNATESARPALLSRLRRLGLHPEPHGRGPAPGARSTYAATA